MSRKNILLVSFFSRKTRVNKNGMIPIYMRIYLNRVRKDISINKMVELSQWSSQANRVIGHTKEAVLLNNYMDSLKARVTSIFHELDDKYDDLTIDMLVNAINGKFVKAYVNLINLHTKYNEKVAGLVGIDYRKSTLVRYNTSLKHLKNFILYQYKAEDYSLKKINHEFVTGYDYYLKVVCRMQHNSAVKYHKNLKRVLSYARANQWITHDPYIDYKLSIKKTDRGFLDDRELEILRNKIFSNNRLNIVKDCFLVSCFTGLAYSDLEKLSQENIYKDKNAKKWIKINRVKTGVQSIIPVLNVVDEIIMRYENHPLVISKNKLLPVTSNQKMNAYLKEIADLCGIDKHLSTHLARHTFATTVTLNNNVPIETVSKMLGHTSLKTTKIYARLLDKKIGEDMSNIDLIYR